MTAPSLSCPLPAYRWTPIRGPAEYHLIADLQKYGASKNKSRAKTMQNVALCIFNESPLKKIPKAPSCKSNQYGHIFAPLLSLFASFAGPPFIIQPYLGRAAVSGSNLASINLDIDGCRNCCFVERWLFPSNL